MRRVLPRAADPPPQATLGHQVGAAPRARPAHQRKKDGSEVPQLLHLSYSFMVKAWPRVLNDVFLKLQMEQYTQGFKAIIVAAKGQSESEGAFYTVHSKICCVIPGT